MVNYVCGFLHDDSHVVLIEKQGLLNGVGGKIKEDEIPRDAMCREFEEEAGLYITDWGLGAILTSSDWQVYFYSAHRHGLDTIDKHLRIVPIRRLRSDVILNLRWLIPLCLDSKIKKPVVVLHDRRL